MRLAGQFGRFATLPKRELGNGKARKISMSAARLIGCIDVEDGDSHNSMLGVGRSCQ